jgi:hypothetical protein
VISHSAREAQKGRRGLEEPSSKTLTRVNCITDERGSRLMQSGRRGELGQASPQSAAGERHRRRQDGDSGSRQPSCSRLNLRISSREQQRRTRVTTVPRFTGLHPPWQGRDQRLVLKVTLIPVSYYPFSPLHPKRWATDRCPFSWLRITTAEDPGPSRVKAKRAATKGLVLLPAQP